MRSHTLMTTLMACSTRRIVMPCWRIRAMKPIMASISSAFMPVTGSSRQRSLGSVASAAATPSAR